MIKLLYNTNVLTASKMLDVTDESIIAMSNGEVTNNNLYDEEDKLLTNLPNLASEEIFGKIGEKSLKMGHIHTPVSIVNIQYFRGKKPILPSILQMDRKDVEAIIYCHTFVNKETGRLMKQTNVNEFCSEGYLTGAEGIKYLLDMIGYSSDRIILNNIPVIPLWLRVDVTDYGRVTHYPVEELYYSFLQRCNRYRMLEALESVPPIILQCERECLQRYADNLICNGATSFTKTSFYGIPLESLQNVAERIEDMDYQFIDFDKIVGKYSDKENYEKLLNDCKIFAELYTQDDETDGEEYTALSKEDEQKLNELQKKVCNSADLISKKIFDAEFSEYSDYEAEFVEAAKQSAIDCINNVEDVSEVDKNLIECIIFGMYMQMVFLKKYRVQWLDSESED